MLKTCRIIGLETESLPPLVLGTIPIFFLAFGKAMEASFAFQTKKKALWEAGGHEGLEELGRQLSEITSLLKKGDALHKKLDPCAPFHQKRDTEALKQAVSDVKEFIQALPDRSRSPEALQEIDFAYKGIMAKKQLRPTKKAKPSLNVEDVDQ